MLWASGTGARSCPAFGSTAPNLNKNIANRVDEDTNKENGKEGNVINASANAPATSRKKKGRRGHTLEHCLHGTQH